MFANWTFLILLIFLPLHFSWANACIELFQSKSVSVQYLEHPKKSKTLTEVKKVGRFLKKHYPDPVFYTLDTYIPKSIYKNFFELSIEKLNTKINLLNAELKNPNSAYSQHLNFLSKKVIPDIEKIKFLIENFLNNPEKEAHLRDYIHLASPIAFAMNYLSTEAYKTIALRTIESHRELLAFNEVKQFYKNPSSDLLFKKIISLGQLNSKNVGHQFSALKFILNFNTDARLPSQRISFISVEGAYRGYLIPYFSWTVPAEYVQLYARANRLHIVSFRDQAISYDNVTDDSPSNHPIHDLIHKITTSDLEGDPANPSFSAEKLPSPLPLNWFNELSAFLDFFSSRLNNSGLSDLQKYAAIHVLALASHEMGLSYDAFIDPSNEVNHATFTLFSDYYGEKKFLSGREQELVDLGLNVLTPLVRKFKQSWQNR